MRLTLATLFAGLCVGAVAQGTAAPGKASDAETARTVTAQAADSEVPEFEKLVSQARDNRRTVDERVTLWKQANAAANDRCDECYNAIIAIQFAMRDWSSATATSLQFVANATSSTERFRANMDAAKSLSQVEQGLPSLDQFRQAEPYARAAVIAFPRSISALNLEGEILATLGRDAEAKGIYERAQKLVKVTDPRYDDILRFAGNPHLAAKEIQAVRADIKVSIASADGRLANPAAQGAVVSSASTASSGVPEPAYKSDPKFQKALAEAKRYSQNDEDRLSDWKHANKVAKGECVECLRQQLQLQRKLGAFKDAVATSTQLEAVATEPGDKLFALVGRGYALMSYNYGQPKPEQAAQAHEAFQAVLAKGPNSAPVVYEDGRALAVLGKTEEARTRFAHYVDIVPASDKLRTRAERFSDDPRLATLPMAPPFRLVTSDGQQMELDEMNGKVVLLDFWATWCGPCKESLPEIARIAKDYANDPMLVVISVSSDSNESEWKAFMQKNNMTWPQYRDANGALSRAYGVSSIPHFFSIDTNGTLKTEQVGSGANVRGVVSDLVKKAHKAEAQKAKMTDKASAGQ